MTESRPTEAAKDHGDEKVERMPCRGCTLACPNYASCDGAPWRQPPAQVAPRVPA